MLDVARDIVGAQPILTLFLAIGVGYLVGQINFGGFSLGVGAVLFVGLAIGAFAPKAQITGPIGLTGLIMFLYGIGVLYGRQFFEGMVGSAGRKYNLLALVACVASLFVALGLGKVFDIKIGHTLGIYAGSMTSTATLQAALDTMGNKEPSIGYSIAYPFGVIGPILCIYFMTRMLAPKFPPKSRNFHMGEITLAENFAARTLGDLGKELPDGVQVTLVRKASHNLVPSDAIMLDPGDGLMIIADRQDAIAEAVARLGSLVPGRIVKDRAAVDYIRVFVGKANVVGVPLGKLALPTGFPVHILHVRRYDTDIVPSPDLMLEFGDRVGVLMPPDRRDEIRQYFGDTIKAAAEFSYVSLGVGMVLGVLLGLIPIPIPGVGTVTLGIGGGPLLVALVLGKLRRTGPMLWAMPLPANIVLRNYGLAMFLATVGVNAGQPFVRTVAESGLTMLFIGVAVLLTTVLIVLLIGYYVLKIPFDDLLGIASGATGNPAILVYSTRMVPTERPDIGYAMIFPSMTIVKVIAVQIVGLVVGAGPSDGHFQKAGISIPERQLVIASANKGGGATESDGTLIVSAIRLAALGLLIYWSLLILKPFIAVIVWSVIFTVALYPAFDWLVVRVHMRRSFAAALITIVAVLVIIGPVTWLGLSLAENLRWLFNQFDKGGLVVPPPPAAVDRWPLVGHQVSEMWLLASTNLKALLVQIGPQLKSIGGRALGIAGGAGINLIKFVIAIVISGFLFLPGPSLANAVRNAMRRVATKRGESFVDLAGATIRNVSRGVIGIAALQAILVGIGLMVAGFPAAGLLSFLALLLGIVQIGPGIILLPLIIVSWFTMSTTGAFLFTAYMIPVTLIDNVLRPFVMAHGLTTPMPVILVGLIGGVLAHGFIGLFVGPIIISIAWQLLVAWVQDSAAAAEGPPAGVGSGDFLG